MVMIKDNECGHDISDENKLGPDCGAPLNEQQDENEEDQLSTTMQTKRRFPIKTAIIVIVCILVICGSAYFILTKYFNKDAIEYRSYKKIAELGDAEAQDVLGWCYYKGHGVKQDYNEAVKWYRKSAEQGCALGQFDLACSYARGIGVEQNNTEAVKWLRKAADQGNVKAQYQLGLCYFIGDGVTKNIEDAAKYWQKAAEQGYAPAQYNLGLCYEKGNGVTIDMDEAIKWYSKAAEQGFEYAKAALYRLLEDVE